MSRDDVPHKKPPAGVDMQQVREQARLLKKRQGWDPGKFASRDPREAMRELNQVEKNKEVYEQRCEACVTAREQSGDETSLCPTHLAEAMGF